MPSTTSPMHEVAHLGHVELLTPDPEASLRFFTEIMGLRECARDGDSVYLRTYRRLRAPQPDPHRSRDVRSPAHGAAGRGAPRRWSGGWPPSRRRVAASAGARAGTASAAVYAFVDPDGHEFELYWESEHYRAPQASKPALKNQAEAKPSHGVGVRRLDHVNFLAADVEANGVFQRELLGARTSEQIRLDDGRIAAQWHHFNNKSYDLVYTEDWTGSRGRLHHIAFATDTREEILRAADVFLDAGVFIETGPHKHAIQQTFFLYVYEPGGNRIELCNPVSRLLLAPDWETVTWTEAERAKGQAWGLKTIESFHTHGTPPVPHAG